MKSPRLRFIGFNNGEFLEWKSVRFGDHAQVNRGGSPRPIQDYITNDADGLNWIKIGDVSPKTNHIKSTKEKIKKSGLNKTREVHPGDLILSNSMSFGRPYIVDIDGCIHDGWLLITNYSDAFIKEFLCYLLVSENIKRQYTQYAAGSTVQNLNSDIVQGLSVSIPSLSEQQKIADFLSSYDEKISIQRERVEALERRKKGLLQKVLSQEIRFKADDGSEFPEWNEIPFCMAFSSISNNTLSRSELSYDVKTSVRNIHYGDVLIKFGAVIHTNIDNIPYVIEIDDKLTKEKLLKSGDVIFAATAEDNTVGKACELVLDDDSDNIVAGLHTIAVRPNETFAFGYLGYFFNSTLFHDQLLPLIQGIKVSSISKRALFSETKVFYPSLPEQMKIADFFTAIDDQINIEKERLATMETIKKGLLQGLFC